VDNDETGRITFLCSKATIREFKILAAYAGMSLTEYFSWAVETLKFEKEQNEAGKYRKDVGNGAASEPAANTAGFDGSSDEGGRGHDPTSGA
jgi:hypothetical protein